jgi:hypothetical protein
MLSAARFRTRFQVRNRLRASEQLTRKVLPKDPYRL